MFFVRRNLNKNTPNNSFKLFQETKVSDKFKNLTFTVVLVQPETVGNIGSIARVMKNFDFKDLIIFNSIEPVEKLRDQYIHGFAMHGFDILLDAKILNVPSPEEHLSEFKKFLSTFDLIIATTAKGRQAKNIKRTPILIEDLSLPTSERPLNVAILFGKESTGLNNEEIALADIVVRIPTGNDYPSMNLSHACTVILYEVFKKTHTVSLGSGKKPMMPVSREERQMLYNFVQELIEMLKIKPFKKKTMINAFKNIFERAIVSKKEFSHILSFFSKIHSIFKKLNLYQD